MVNKIRDNRPAIMKTSITGCMNCNHPNACMNGSEYKKVNGTNSDACVSRVFAGDNELYAYIESQYN